MAAYTWNALFALVLAAGFSPITLQTWHVAIAADTPVVFWRARRANPISEWYVKLCDGFARLPDWTVYWKGIAVDAIPKAIEWAVKQPVDIPNIPRDGD